MNAFLQGASKIFLGLDWSVYGPRFVSKCLSASLALNAGCQGERPGLLAKVEVCAIMGSVTDANTTNARRAR